MKFKTWFENIEVPPHMPELFWDENYKKAIELESKFIPLREIEKLEKWLSDEESFETHIDYSISFMYRIFNNDYGQRLSERIKNLNDSQDLKMGRSSIRKSLENIDFMNDELFRTRYKDFVDSYTNFFRTKKISPNADTRTKPSEMSEEGRKKYIKLKSVYDSVFQYIKLIKKVSRKARAMSDTLDRGAITIDQQYRADSDRKQGRVPSDADSIISSEKIRDIEILYHATPFVKEILSQGFKTKEELGNVNMLGGDTSGGISFTADMNIAIEIVKCLKDVIQISQGKIKASDIIRMTKADRNFSNQSADNRLWPLDNFINTAKRNKSIKDIESKDPDFINKMRNYDNTQYKLEDLSSPKMVFEMYKRYLGYTRKRYNPLFFGANIESFSNLDINNIGVLACRVDMNKAIKYLHSMEEYRVPKNSILKIWKIKNIMHR
jgi:hypothetical protein